MPFWKTFSPRLLCCLVLGALPAMACDTHRGALPVAPGAIPPGASRLFNGHDLTGWRALKGGPPLWKVEDGEVEVVPGTGSIATESTYQDFFLHLEYKLPLMAEKSGQDRANSGIYLLNRYEVQILDSFGNPTYFAGHAGSLYRRTPAWEPDGKNVSLPPGHWQSFDILFRAPRVSEGKMTEPGRVTVLHNHVPVLVEVRLDRGTGAMEHAPGVVDEGPIVLQEHGAKVRFRNIWIQPLPSLTPPRAERR